MPAVMEGLLDGSGKRFGIVVSRFNDLISKKLLEGALDCLLRHKADRESITIAWTPGALEIPLVVQQMAASGKFDAIICLGAVIRGGTPHFDFVASETSKGIAKVSLDRNIPIINGVLTTDTIDQAIERAGTKAGNRGWNAAQSAIEMADLMGKLQSP
jgi:6,7-dimethyl-8-ribityllumazine synthase